MHVPVELARRARDVAAELDADGWVAVGGSGIGLARRSRSNTACRSLLPRRPTPGRRWPRCGADRGGQKRTGRDARVLPSSVLYDPELTRSLSPQLWATSAMNAIAHAVEGLDAPDATPIVSLMAAEAVRALTGALPCVVADGSELDAAPTPLTAPGHAGRSAEPRRCRCTTSAATHPRRHSGPAGRADPHRRPAARAGLRPAGHSRRDRRAVPGRSAARQTRRGSCGSSPVGSAPRSLAELGTKDNEIPRITELAIAVPYAKPPTDHPRRCRGGAPSRMARRTAPHLLVAP
jgi:maleylacetate reductase